MEVSKKEKKKKKKGMERGGAPFFHAGQVESNNSPAKVPRLASLPPRAGGGFPPPA